MPDLKVRNGIGAHQTSSGALERSPVQGRYPRGGVIISRMRLRLRAGGKAQQHGRGGGERFLAEHLVGDLSRGPKGQNAAKNIGQLIRQDEEGRVEVICRQASAISYRGLPQRARAQSNVTGFVGRRANGAHDSPVDGRCFATDNDIIWSLGLCGSRMQAATISVWPCGRGSQPLPERWSPFPPAWECLLRLCDAPAADSFAITRFTPQSQGTSGGALTEIRFLANEARKAEGLAYAGFETFRGSPYNSCARETGQNSRDAPGGAGPVRVSFRLLHIDRKDVPFADSLEHSVRACLKEPGDEKTRLHLETALKTVSDPVLKVLEIADFNTTGLTGPTDDPHSVFTALVKGDGVTNKPGEDSAGSFGIGKNAAYAVSALQTVIYSTRYRDRATGQKLFAAQGRLRLISHQDEAGPRSAEGYWGNPDFTAVEDVTAVPAWMARSEIGTTILSMGFIEQPSWAGRMTLSLVTNFFVAIDRGEIEFAVEDTVINAVSLDSILADTTLQTLAEETAQLAELERARRLLRCTRSEMATRHHISVKGLGDFTLHLLVEQDLPREVHILRNGIYITDNFRKFAMPLRQFPGTREFSAVLEPARTEAGRAPSALLKQLENPAHDAFEPERITNPDRQDLARRQIKSLHAKVREIIRAEARISDVRRSRLEELSDMFADTQHRSADEDAEGEISPDRYTFSQPTRARRRPQAGVPGDGPGRRRGGGERKQPGARKGGGGGRPTGEGGGAVPLEGVRSRVPDGDGGQKRVIWFTPGSSGEIELAISAAGLADDIQLSIVGADTGVAARGRVRATVTAGERVRLEVLLSEPYDGPVELDAVRFSAAAGAGAAGE